MSFKCTSNKISVKLQAMVDKPKNAIPFLKKVIFPMYQQAQLTRWQTENTSETGQWKSIDKKYAERKLKKYSGFPGGGSKLMIATDTLRTVVTNQTIDTRLKRVVTTRGMTISIDDGALPYAKYAAISRPFMSFGGQTILAMRDAISDWIKHG